MKEPKLGDIVWTVWDDSETPIKGVVVGRKIHESNVWFVRLEGSEDIEEVEISQFTEPLRRVAFNYVIEKPSSP